MILDLIDETAGVFQVYCLCEPSELEKDRLIVLVQKEGLEEPYFEVFATQQQIQGAWLGRLLKALKNPRATCHEKWHEDYVAKQNPLEQIKLPDPDPTTIRKDIKRLVKLGKKAKFKDFLALKVGGRDEFSRMKVEQLEQYLEENDLRGPTDEEVQNVSRLSVLRWVARGLPLEMAIHKVSVDAEVTANAQKSKSNAK